MSKRSAPFKQSDVTRAAKGVVAAGLAVVGVEIDAEGKIVVRCTEGQARDGASEIDRALGIK